MTDERTYCQYLINCRLGDFNTVLNICDIGGSRAGSENNRAGMSYIEAIWLIFVFGLETSLSALLLLDSMPLSPGLVG